MENQKSRKQPQYSGYIKYSAFASQMIITLLLAGWGGKKLDAWMENPKPYFTILLMMWGLAGVIYLLIKNLQNEQKKDTK
jgi:ATP synthase protein I